jgi:predicted nucleic-acid-binding Zn-ribbon protein
MNTKPCPKCGSTELERGHVYLPTTLQDIRFKADTASTFSVKKRVSAFACKNCGFIEFYLTDHDDTPTA